MRFTRHGYQRAQERRAGPIDELSLILRKSAFIFLGCDNGTTFHCFYSRHDNRAKIMLTGETKDGKDILFSVWEKHFGLPAGITPVTDFIEHKALCKLRRMYATLGMKRAKAEGTWAEEEIGDLSVAVFHNERSVFEAHHNGVARSSIKKQPHAVDKLYDDLRDALVRLRQEDRRERGRYHAIIFFGVLRGTCIQYELKRKELLAII